MNNRPPLNEAFPSPGWSNWLSQVFQCLPWKKALNVTATLDFGSVSAQSQATLTATVTGARAGDAVLVTAPDTSGIAFSACVTADDTVSVYAKNFTAGAINPTAKTFRLVVLQN